MKLDGDIHEHQMLNPVGFSDPKPNFSSCDYLKVGT